MHNVLTPETNVVADILARSTPGKRFAAYVWSQFSGWVRGGQFDALADASGVVSASAGEVLDNVECKPILRIAPASAALSYASSMGIAVDEWRNAAVGTSGLGHSILPANWDARRTKKR
jgi:hypothetical protein